MAVHLETDERLLVVGHEVQEDWGACHLPPEPQFPLCIMDITSANRVIVRPTCSYTLLTQRVRVREREKGGGHWTETNQSRDQREDRHDPHS